MEADLGKQWLDSRNFDLPIFHLSALLCLALIIPYFFWGNQATIPIYNFYLLFFGIPHNFLTWVSFIGKDSKKEFDLRPIITAAIVCGVICVVMYLNPNTELENWILSIITYASLWHAYRQHHGICKIYDTVQAARTNDTTIYEDRRILNLGFGLSIFAVLVWLFTHPQVEFLLSADSMYNLLYPQVSFRFFVIYSTISGLVFLWGLKRAVVDRFRRGLWVPWPQVLLMLMALLTYSIPFLFLPLEALPIGVAIATIFHNIQYFGFVWLYMRVRGELRFQGKEKLRFMEELAVERRWLLFIGVSLVYSIFMVGIYGLSQSRLVLAFIYFLAFAHYIVDGILWRSKVNYRMSSVVKVLAGS